MKVKILTCGHNRIGEIVEAKRFKDLTKDEIDASIGSNYKWEYMTDEEIEIVEE